MTTTGLEATEKILLYYPTIDIPSPSWIRQGIMYWDKIGSIVPNSYDEHLPKNLRYSNQIQPLYDANLFRPYNPEDLWRLDGWRGDAFEAFKTELLETYDSDEFQAKLPNLPKADWRMHSNKLFRSRVYSEKVNDILKNELLERQLIAEPKDEFVYFEKNAALVYMAILAKHLASIDYQLTVPSTDLPEYERLNFKAKDDMSNPCLRIEFNNLLRVPADDVEIQRVIDFRLEHNDKLVKFRKDVLNKFENEIRKCTERREIQEKTTQLKDEIETGITELNRVLDKGKFQTFTGTLKILIKPLVGALTTGGSAGAATGSIETSLIAGTIGLIGGATIEIVDYFASKSSLKEKLNKDALSYLYLAQRDLKSKKDLISLNLSK